MNAADGDDPASGRDTSIVEALVRETGREAALVKELYEREFAKLAATAKVHSFLPVLAHRNVRTALRKTCPDTN